MALLTAQTISTSGITPTMSAATATTGDTFQVDDRTYLRVVNGSGASITCTVTSYRPATDGYTVADKTFSVAANSEKIIILDPVAFTDPTTGLAKVVCSAVTSVTVAAIRRP